MIDRLDVSFSKQELEDLKGCLIDSLIDVRVLNCRKRSAQSGPFALASDRPVRTEYSCTQATIASEGTILPRSRALFRSNAR